MTGYRATPCIDSPRLVNCPIKSTLPSGGGGELPAFRPAGRSAYNQQNQEGVPGGHSLFCSLWRYSGQGKGAPVRVPPAGGPRPTRPCGLRAATRPTLCGGGAAARPASPFGSVREMWRLVAACRRLRPSQPPAVARATRARRKAKPASGPLRGPCPGHSPRSVAAQVLRGGPAPTMWGLWGRPPLRPGRRHSGQPCQPGHACGAGRAARLCLRTRRPA